MFVEVRSPWGPFKALCALILLILTSGPVHADSNQNLIYQGRIARPDGTALNSGSVTFTLSVHSPAPSSCLLYQETQTIPMTGSGGLFSLNLGAGTRTDAGLHSFNQAFINNASLSGLTCASGTSYAAGSTDERVLSVKFDDAGTLVSLSPMKIKSVPFALQAHEIDGWGINNLVKVSSIGSPTTFTTAEMANAKAMTGAACSAGEVLKWNGSAWACAADITTGAATDAGYTAANKGIVAFDTNAATSGITVASGVASVNTGTGNNQIVKLDGTAKLPAVDGSALTSLTPANLSAAVPINKGGTGQTTAILGFNALSPITAKGDLITFNGTNNVSLPVGSNGYVLTADSAQATGLKWAAASTGTVTSVTSANSDIAVATSTSTPVLTLNSGTGANQIVKLDGSAKLPAVDGSALTNLNAGNISAGTLPVTRGGTGNTTFGNNGVVVSNGTGTSLQTLNCTSGQVITFDVSGYAVCGAGGGGGGSGFNNGGNSFAAAADLGTNDNHPLYIRTNNNTRLAILATGEVGIGTSTPAFQFEVSKDSTVTSGTVAMNKQSLSISPGAASTATHYNQHIHTDLVTNNTTGPTYGIFNEMVKSGSNPGSVRMIENNFTTSNSLGSATIPSIIGTSNNLSVSRSGMTTTNMYGTFNTPQAIVGTVTNAYGTYNIPQAFGSGTMTNAYGSYNESSSAGANTISNAYGSYNTITTSLGGAVTNGYGVYIGPISATNKWSLYASDATAPSYFAGKVGIGTTSPASSLEVSGDITLSKGAARTIGVGKIAGADGNDLTVTAGSTLTNTYKGGDLNLLAGNARPTGGDGKGGSVAISGGFSGLAGTSGDVTIQTQFGNSNDPAGSIYLLAGANLSTGRGGSIFINPGTGASDGVISLADGAGRVGIGISTPLAKLHIVETSGVALRIVDGNQAAGKVLTSDANGNAAWSTPAAGGAGTVTSVTSANSDISVATGTSTPVLTLNSGTGNNQIVKLTAAGRYPAVNGSLITSLDAGNISAGTLPVTRGGTGNTTFGNNGVVVSNGTGTSLQTLNCTSGQVITFDVSGYAICGSVGGSSLVNGGNSFASAATLGTNDANALNLETNGANRMTIAATGEVGIGTSAPSSNAKLEIVGAAASRANIITNGGTVDLSLSNVHVLKSVGGPAITLNNMTSGGSYTLIISDTSQRTYTFSGCTNTYFSPANTDTFQRSTFSILTVMDGGVTDCYVNWVTGFN